MSRSTGEELSPREAGPEGGRTVLVVDDNYELRHSLAMILGISGYRVILAADGAEAVRLAEAHHPGLVLMDLMMPVMDGWTAAERIREGAGASSIPLVAISAHYPQADQAERTRSLFDDFVAKPITATSLLRLVAERVGVGSASGALHAS